MRARRVRLPLRGLRADAWCTAATMISATSTPELRKLNGVPKVARAYRVPDKFADKFDPYLKHPFDAQMRPASAPQNALPPAKNGQVELVRTLPSTLSPATSRVNVPGVRCSNTRLRSCARLRMLVVRLRPSATET